MVPALKVHVAPQLLRITGEYPMAHHRDMQVCAWVQQTTWTDSKMFTVANFEFKN